MDGYADDLAGFDNLPCNTNIFIACITIQAGLVVGDDDTCSGCHDRTAEDFAGVGERSVQQSLRDDFEADYLVR